MHRNQFKFSDWIYILFAIISLIILVDFILPGKSLTEPILKIEKEHQQYYNAARNYHYSYRLFTNTRNFNVSESFAKEADLNKPIVYEISYIFKEINSYSNVDIKSINTYSLRLMCGFVLPLLGIIVMTLALKYKNKVSILSFVFQILLILDIIYLIN